MEAGEELNVAARGLATGYRSGSAMPGSASALLVAHFSRRRRTAATEAAVTRSSILGLELLHCTSPRAATLPCSEPPWRSGRRMPMSARILPGCRGPAPAGCSAARSAPCTPSWSHRAGPPHQKLTPTLTLI